MSSLCRRERLKLRLKPESLLLKITRLQVMVNKVRKIRKIRKETRIRKSQSLTREETVTLKETACRAMPVPA